MTPDEHGWYWVKIVVTGQWCMAHVHTGREQIRMFDGDDPSDPQYISNLDEEQADKRYGPLEWHGPIHCPGGDFGQETVLLSEETLKAAHESKAAVVLEHYDFSECDGDGIAGRVTKVKVVSEDAAHEQCYGRRDANE